MSDYSFEVIANLHRRVVDGEDLLLYGRRYVPAPLERDSLVVRFRRWLAEKVAP